MTMRKTVLVYVVVLVAALIVSEGNSRLQVRPFECHEVMVPMRDGVKLATDVYVPTGTGRDPRSQGRGPFPVIVKRTPYNKGECGNIHAQYFARRGYVAVVQDERGTYNSEGEYYWFRDNAWGEHQDGYDAIEWAGTQPWSNGKVGTIGLSMGGDNQYLTAPTKPPHLTAMFPAQAGPNPYRDSFYQGGGGAPHMIMAAWLLTQNEMSKPFRINFGPGRRGYVGSLETWLKWYVRKTEGGLKFGESLISDMMSDLLRNPYYNDYWRQFAVDERWGQVDVPMYHFTSWYDRYSKPGLQYFNGARNHGGPKARNSQKIILGPWTHGTREIMPRVVGDIDFGPDAAIDYNALRLRWFDYQLKGIDNGIMEEPPVKIFVMGANTWRFENEFPLARTVYTDYFLRGGPSGSIDSLNDGLLLPTKPGDDKPDAFEYDPLKPVPTIGGDLFIQPNGARDHRPTDRLSLTYTSPPLDRDTEITGPPKVEFYASSSALDTDWVATISDVHPDGYSQILRQNILRARYREGDTGPVLMVPGQVYRFTIELYPISNLFKKGHRIRLTMTSSSFPKWFPNGNTGREMEQDFPVVVAMNTLYHDRERPSRIILPMIPISGHSSDAKGR